MLPLAPEQLVQVLVLVLALPSLLVLVPPFCLLSLLLLLLPPLSSLPTSLNFHDTTGGHRDMSSPNMASSLSPSAEASVLAVPSPPPGAVPTAAPDASAVVVIIVDLPT
jgi:hypothetical protein